MSRQSAGVTGQHTESATRTGVQTCHTVSNPAFMAKILIQLYINKLKTTFVDKNVTRPALYPVRDFYPPKSTISAH